MVSPNTTAVADVTATLTNASIANQLPITHLNLPVTQVKLLTAMSKSALRYLDMSHTPIGDLTPLQDSRLRELIITNSAVVEFGPLKHLPSLHRLVVSDTEANRQRLRKLELSDRIRVILR